MNAKTHIQTRAFEVEDGQGHREILIHTRPLSIDEHGNALELPLAAEWRLRNGESVYPLSDNEFIGAHGKRWRKIVTGAAR